MSPNNSMTGSTQREPRIQSQSLLRDESVPENDLENRIRNLDKLVNSTYAALCQESFPSKPHALDLVNDLRVKIRASQNLLRVARLLSEPARESIFSKIHDSLNDLEEVVASQLGVKTDLRS
jgi:hypothetical protein